MDKQLTLFEKRLADLLRAMILTSSDIAELIAKNNILIKLELFTYLFWILDYALVINKADQDIRKEVNKNFDDTFYYSKHWKGLHVNNLSNYIDDRLFNYTEIIKYKKGFNPEYYEKIIDYQTELIIWVIKKETVRIGFIAVPKKKEDYQPIDMDIIDKSQIKISLQEAYIGIMANLISKMLRNAKTEYFLDENYNPK